MSNLLLEIYQKEGLTVSLEIYTLILQINQTLVLRLYDIQGQREIKVNEPNSL